MAAMLQRPQYVNWESTLLFVNKLDNGMDKWLFAVFCVECNYTSLL